MRSMWKILPVVLMLAALLAGCGGKAPDSMQSGLRPEPSTEVWGTAVDPAVTQSQDSAADPVTDSTADSAVEPAPAPSATPSPVSTPEPQPESLRELVDTEIPVWINGVELRGLLINGTTLVDAGEVMDIAPGYDFQWKQYVEASEERFAFLGKDGTYAEIGYTMVGDTAHGPEKYDGTGGIYFEGHDGMEFWLPVRWLSDLIDANLLWDSELGTVYLTSRVDKTMIPVGEGIPVLMYHAVSDDLWSSITELFVSPEDMRQQIEYLLENGYTPIFFSDLPNLEEIEKPILLTFDDAYDDNYTELFPILQEYGVKATVFVITGMLGDEHYITAEQAQEMSDSGLVDIQSHTVDHYELADLSWEDQEYQLSQSRLEIARITGRVPYALAYPSGSRSGDTLDLAMEYYDFGIDMNGGTWYTEADERDFYQVDRIYISRENGVEGFIARLP